MLRADEPIELLIEKLDALARPDRAAILKRLSPRQREQIERLRARHRAVGREIRSPELSRRIAELTGGKSPLAPAACEALRRAVQAEATNPARETARGSSLADAAGSLFRRRGSA